MTYMNKTIIFTDGSSRGNPGPGGWGSVVINGEKVQELGGRDDNTTNNRMEIMACIEGLSAISSGESVTVYSDSSYVINGITKWIFAWKRNNWITKTKEEVLNRDLWEKLYNVTVGKKIDWKYIGGHSGISGNERCDEIATSFADNKNIILYKGNITDYSIKNILDLSSSIEKISKKSHSKAKAYSYVSMIDGEIETHQTWAECEKRVNGKTGAKYKKAISSDNENEIIAEFTKK